ncbi:HEPN domain-containing protein [Aliarcobacter butzleri]|uniref:HEPN domain-containing protein n=1 Tax=Aliarcobacter butzleri TaxID=28197 RepID=UPI00125FD717|nr:HEPN domain-containing protein [Aliarcobacter butzleri]MCT7594686.1 HEPN domain-containing protein [Aliarcobacter butzleri]MCT7598401.1 HEPN domain-containing protein [Aliarcobacter butzleri]MCT7651745.1 HEPN domain-containing protein [Aliarcobacter butzleri]
MKAKIEGLLNKEYKKLSDPIIQSHFLNYTCVLISGYLEKEIQNLLDIYKTTSHFRSHDCSKELSSMRKIQNAKWCSVRPTLTNIDNKVILKLSKLKDFSLVTSSINNIVNTRHKIAHGENVTNLTIDILKQDFKNINRFLKKLKSIFTSL